MDTQITHAAHSIDTNDMGYHLHIGKLMAKRDALAQQAQAITNELQKIQGAVSSWSEYLSEKYELHDGDGVTNAGEIVRTEREVDALCDQSTEP